MRVSFPKKKLILPRWFISFQFLYQIFLLSHRFQIYNEVIAETLRNLYNTTNEIYAKKKCVKDFKMALCMMALSSTNRGKRFDISNNFFFSFKFS